MTCISIRHHFQSHTITTTSAFLFLVLPLAFASLNSDGLLLLSFKSSVLSDPLSLLSTWNAFDNSPCQWRGVTCSFFLGDIPDFRVTALALPSSRLLGSIPSDLGLLPRLRHLDLSDNFLNGTLPYSIFNATDLQTISLSNNELSGEIPPLVANLRSLQTLNLSDNALAGQIPAALTALPNLTLLCLSNNYFSGGIPGDGFQWLQFADLSSNLINGSLPPQFAGGNLRSLNLSYNRLSGGISTEFATRTPVNASLDLSFNNLTGEIPATGVFLNQKPDSFAGNPDLCGKPVKNPCSIPSTLSTPPNVTTSPLAIAAIPKTLGSPGGGGASAAGGNASHPQKEGGLRPRTIAGIVVGDLVGIGIVSMVFLYIYHSRKKQTEETTTELESKEKDKNAASSSPSSSPTTHFGLWCLKKRGGGDSSSSSNDDEESTESEKEEENQQERESEKKEKEEQSCNLQQEAEEQQKRIGGGRLVTVDGESELELETLLKASAYVLGATGSNIVYKAVLDDGTTFAVRRMGESGVGSSRDFESQVRVIAKLRHPNILRIRGFYWGEDDKLVIFDYATNGSLASAYLKKQGSTPCQLSWDIRVRIARGVARGLVYLHEKKYFHGNLKPSNILLGEDMEPKISDFGMDKLASSDNPSKGTSGLATQFGSKRSSSLPRDNHQDAPSTGAIPSVFTRCTSPYHAPESLKNLKPNSKWDVYSFGIVLLELLSGKVFSDTEVSGSISSEWNIISGEKNRVLKMVDVALRDDMEGKEEALLACFKLGFSCASVTPQKRPSMKEALQILDKIPP
ncbi:putative LRR receptor-like serine/threonine-protein kinase [Cinnamomum micranthum f. kanehirae]|uniref:non-specific serine/threonine protein kinase n=1 Tax=Cinnamomum micranthum f. kanehirae TaxID=337451 RepID=A0A443NSB0_9MAGN|nr:putative LRR receptor-like serine/threonine-protein kinase [Cinnamomum micranthum f. kanehirae]